MLKADCKKVRIRHLHLIFLFSDDEFSAATLLFESSKIKSIYRDEHKMILIKLSFIQLN